MLKRTEISVRVVTAMGLALLLTVLFPYQAEARSLQMDKIVYEAELLPDGSMQVTEHITATFNGTYKGFFVTIPQDHHAALSDIVVAENGVPFQFNSGEHYGPPGTYLVKPADNKVTIDWSIDAADQQRTFEVSYRVHNAVRLHTDVAEFYRKFVGEDNEQPIGQVVVRVLLPEGAENYQAGSDIRIWGHGPLQGEVDFAGPREVIWEMTNLPAREFMEGRMTLPVDLFPAAGLHTGQTALPMILEEEGQWADEANRERLASRLQTAAAILALMGTLMVLFLLWFRYGKEYRPQFEGEYYRELPADYSPAEMSVLWNWGAVKTHDMTATLLDMARRGYLVIEQQLFEKKRLLGSKEVTTYRLTLQREKYDRDRLHLRPHESELLDFIFTTISEHQASLYLYDIEEFSKKRSQEFYSFWLEWKNGLMMTGAANQWFMGTPGRTRWLVAGIGLLLFIACVLTIKAELTVLGISLLISSFLMGIVPQIYKKRSPAAQEDLRKWQAFRRFLQHFSNMERHEIPSLIIWEHYLVYAVSLQVAKEVMKQLEVVFPHLQEGHYRFGQHWYYDQAGLGAAGFSDHFAEIAAGIEQSLEKAENIVRKAESRASSGSGGGGGFSGGGGGGSGGGSYGGR